MGAVMSKPIPIEASVYQDKDGAFWLRRSDREPLTELEVHQFVRGCIEHQQIADVLDQLSARLAAIGVEVPDHVREQVIRKTHKTAREQGITKTGSMPDFTKYIG
jgi:hypothetical protein